MASDEDKEWQEWYESTRSQSDKDADYLSWYEDQQTIDPVVKSQSQTSIQYRGETRMAYLLLNFAGNSDSISRPYDRDFYNKPLKEQYEALTARYPQLKRFQYEQFIQACFPVGEQRDYYISMPNFIRGGDEDVEAKFFNNIVIRAARGIESRYVLPNGLEIILIGDVSMRYGELTVKGVELIDGSIFKHGEMAIYATAACAFSNKSLFNGGNVPDYSLPVRVDQSISALTRDLMLSMCKRNYTVSNPTTVLKTYREWTEYIKFRKYYLTAQGESGIAFDECEAIKCYVISRRDYQGNPERYDEHILDNLDGIKKDEQVIVTKQFENSEPFALVRVTVDKNKKELGNMVEPRQDFYAKISANKDQNK
jgi:hypothetical protein